MTAGLVQIAGGSLLILRLITSGIGSGVVATTVNFAMSLDVF